MEYAVRYQIFDRNDRIITKERTFKTEKAMRAFMARVENQNNFHCFTAYSRPDK